MGWGNERRVGMGHAGFTGSRSSSVVTPVSLRVDVVHDASIWIDYVPTESNPADLPSRPEELALLTAAQIEERIGSEVNMSIPQFAKEDREWMPLISIARSAWS